MQETSVARTTTPLSERLIKAKKRIEEGKTSVRAELEAVSVAGVSGAINIDCGGCRSGEFNRWMMMVE